MRKIILIILFILFNIQLSYARPVSKVYRADSRPPEEVFKKGFVAWGNNINFHAHVNGVSGRRGSKDSAFIPTTSSFKSSEKFAKDLLNVSSENKSYIYKIRPTNNFYSALDTVYYYHDQIKERVSDILRTVLTEEQEYSAYINITNQLIELVTIYTKIDSDIIEETIPNPHYSPEETHSSDEPYKGYNPLKIDNLPHLVMGLSMTNINNELAEASAVLPSSSFTWGSVLSTVMEVAETL
ncbi:scabin-related ADP-ribosyltransferase [Proteus terrae]|uniref:scabin-related ADP-ribosyltransferase n=1 Tax=Proteus terrae TaxID=1574161 RepID=UPI001C5CFC54|nr:enterotoxin A family protein [Proteus terrae]